MAINENILDFHKIIKHLELIKNLIALDEEKEIAIHVSKLKELPLSGDLEEIIQMLEGNFYSKAMPAIEIFISNHRQIAPYSDPEIEWLRIEAKTLEAELNALSNERIDLEKLIHEFGIRHNKELGEIILKILWLRKKKAKGTPKQTEAEKDFEDYSKQYQISKNEKIADLTEAEQKELKQKYRKASKLCHPDMVNDDQKELADKLFAELNAAYESNDLKRVKEILAQLEKGDFFVSKSDAINKKQLMKVEIEKLRLRIKQLKVELYAIKESEAYKTISSIDNWDEYFSSVKQKLILQLEEIENGK